MAFFKKTKLNNKKVITIVNVGSYKVRAVVCSFSFGEIKILGYGEKRQSRLDIINNEINNIAGVCETIKQALTKAETVAGTETKNIVINPFFSNTFFYSKSINHKLQNSDSIIEGNDVYKIIEDIEKISIHSVMDEIKAKFGVSKQDLSLILGTVSRIKIDNKYTKSLVGKSGEDINIKLLNCFIPKANYEIIEDIVHFLGKRIYKIIPEEYSITKIGKQKQETVFIDIGSSNTFISIAQKDSTMTGSMSLDIGINDLVKNIRKNSDKNRTEIIKKLDRNDLFKEEKKVFLSFFSDVIITAIKEILGTKICPHFFTFTGGGANNVFIKEHLAKLDFHAYGVKILKEPTFIAPQIDEIKKIMGVENILKISNINLISQIISTQKIIESDNDLIEKALRKSFKKIFNT